MKGTYRRTQNKIRHEKTNFNDWSDPKLKRVRAKFGVGEISSKTRVEESCFEEDEPQSLEESEYSRTSEDIADLRDKIKNGYILLTQKEIRSYRLPFYESLLINLKEGGFLGTYQYISDILDLDEKLHGMNIVSSSGKTKTNLRSRSDILTFLCDGMVEAEVAHLEGNSSTEVRELLDLAVKLSDNSAVTGEDWTWLVEELYDQCIHVADSASAESTDPKLGAIAKHLFAAFLLETRHNPVRAKQFVEESLNQSMGKSWTATEVTGKKSDTLYIESCLLLHKIFIAIAQEHQLGDLQESIKLCRSALYWAKQVNSLPAETAALKQLVKTYIPAGQLNAVPDHLAKYMSLCRELNDVQGVCDGHVLYATYYDLVDEQASVIRNIEELLSLAEQHDILDMMALAHHKMATFYLKRKRVTDIKEHATKAYRQYVELGRKREMDETRCLTGIVHAQAVMKDYINILLQADQLDSPELKIMILWKNLRIPFFSNIELLQPEANTNLEQIDRVELIKNEELLMVSKKRQTDMVKNMPSRLTIKALESYTSVSSGRLMTTNLTQSSSVMNFRQQLRSAEDLSGTS